MKLQVFKSSNPVLHISTNKSPYTSTPPQTAGFSYRCVISSTGSELMASVDANSSVTCPLPVSGIAITEAERVVRIELQWGNGTNTFVIESSSMTQYGECWSIHSYSCYSDVSSLSNLACTSVVHIIYLQNYVHIWNHSTVRNCLSLPFSIQYVGDTYVLISHTLKSLSYVLPPPQLSCTTVVTSVEMTARAVLV